ncbi:hypothetical protein JTE90_004532 [Oedothorax gibbosus]|uniref:Uncharacterized protein n=1 Tax=Oedothorax gibbosus TaxID=931172 RepID=A0AAV6VE57_9ARAC|nr:hypothetical protein JTE90_004532 [Oedothorax gibbosus]
MALLEYQQPKSPLRFRRRSKTFHRQFPRKTLSQNHPLLLEDALLPKKIKKSKRRQFSYPSRRKIIKCCRFATFTAAHKLHSHLLGLRTQTLMAPRSNNHAKSQLTPSWTINQQGIPTPFPRKMAICWTQCHISRNSSGNVSSSTLVKIV